ncbi:MAG TPA: hypothetical protein VGG06_27295 [Thermoanaerobaculia bacterium]
MSEIDEDWTTLHNLAKSRSRMFVSDPKLREFLQEALLPRHRDAYLRLLDVERMARGPVPRQDADAMAPLDPSSRRFREAAASHLHAAARRRSLRLGEGALLLRVGLHCAREGGAG